MLDRQEGCAVYMYVICCVKGKCVVVREGEEEEKEEGD